MRILAAVIMMSCGVVLGQEQYGTQSYGTQSYQPQPYGQQYQVPAQAYIPMQTYQTGPPRYYPRDPYYNYRVNPYVIRPRGVWGIGPIPMGYYW